MSKVNLHTKRFIYTEISHNTFAIQGFHIYKARLENGKVILGCRYCGYKTKSFEMKGMDIADTPLEMWNDIHEHATNRHFEDIMFRDEKAWDIYVHGC